MYSPITLARTKEAITSTRVRIVDTVRAPVSAFCEKLDHPHSVILWQTKRRMLKNATSDGCDSTLPCHGMDAKLKHGPPAGQGLVGEFLGEDAAGSGGRGRKVTLMGIERGDVLYGAQGRTCFCSTETRERAAEPVP